VTLAEARTSAGAPRATTLDAALHEARERDLQRATRALLKRPLLRHADDPDALRLVRQHAGDLRSWFDQNCGWRLQIDTEVARLYKLSAPDPAGTRPARDSRAQLAFGRRRYVLLCLALSVLERADTQITLGRLAEGVIVAAVDERLAAAGITFELAGREERADLVAVVRLLLELGTVERVAGDEDAFVREAGDVLYDVDRRRAARRRSARPTCPRACGSSRPSRSPSPTSSAPARSASGSRAGCSMTRSSTTTSSRTPNWRT
jgi:uncharacterized protein (TIGR02678 family)